MKLMVSNCSMNKYVTKVSSNNNLKNVWGGAD